MPNDYRFESIFQSSNTIEHFLKDGRIIDDGETARSMIERVVNALSDVEHRFGGGKDARTFANALGQAIDNGEIVPSTPIMTNAGRHLDRPMSACTVPPIDLHGDLTAVRAMIDEYHVDGMGTGFDLSDVDSPTAVLEHLNSIAVRGSKSGLEDRPVGNMATCSVRHPRIRDFINAKSFSRRDEEWKFNLSVGVDENFMAAVIRDEPYSLSDGTTLRATAVLDEICTSALDSGDPGIYDQSRMELDNPTPHLGQYRSTAPCAEVGLAPGETCQFAYVNIAKFVTGQTFDWGRLEAASRLALRLLDNALDFSIQRYPTPASRRIMAAKRKVGVGVCGVADALLLLGVSYDSSVAREKIGGAINFINLATKIESMDLGVARGAFPALDHPECRHRQEPSLISRKFAENALFPQYRTEWFEIHSRLIDKAPLRNASTTALPPTGRSALLVGASTGIEPHFSVDTDGQLRPDLLKLIAQHDDREEKMVRRSLSKVPDWLKGALDIAPEDHIEMTAVCQSATDEAVSKTINLPPTASLDDCVGIYQKAYERGLKAISVYRSGSRKNQPIEVK